MGAQPDSAQQLLTGHAVTAMAAAAVTSSSVLPAISVSMLGWSLLWFRLGYLLYGSLFAAGAALVSRQEDAQSALGPVSVIIMLRYFGSIFSAAEPDSTFARALSIVPPVAPFSMPAVWLPGQRLQSI